MRARVSVLMLLLPVIALADGNECKVGEQCVVRGVLRIYVTPPESTAVLEGEGKCIPLALSPTVLTAHEQWTGKAVTVVGLVYAHSVADGVLSYQLQGRAVTGSICRSSPIALFVSEIRAE